MISGIIKVKASAISRGRRPRLITLVETLIILDITKTECNYYFIISCLSEMQVDFFCACKNTRQTHQAAASLETIQVLALFSQRCAVRTVYSADI